MAHPPPAGTDLRRRVPSVDTALQRPEIRMLEERFGRLVLLEELRLLLDSARQAAADGDGPRLQAALDTLPERLQLRLALRDAASLVPVVNATGVAIHTNLGRSPLSVRAAARVAEIAASYSNLELDLASGERGDRETHAEGRLRRLLACPATLVVNNNAAAVLLAVNTLAEDREVVVSRGELVEIGGSFRIPDVVKKGGARLREVGTTNRTRLSDYRAALGPETGLLLKVHPSNFQIVGFTEAVPRGELAALGREAGVPVVEDMGSGLLAPLPPPLSGEETVAKALAAGLDVVTFSGDKLLGGPQAGLLAGRADLIARMRRNPLYRALRVDKMTLAALDVVLADHEAGRAADEVPTLSMLHRPLASVREAAERVAAALLGLPGVEAEVGDDASPVGGGAAPGALVPTVVVRVRRSGRSADALAHALRTGVPPVVATVLEGALRIDLRTVRGEEEETLLAALRRVLGAG